MKYYFLAALILAGLIYVLMNPDKADQKSEASSEVVQVQPQETPKEAMSAKPAPTAPIPSYKSKSISETKQEVTPKKKTVNYSTADLSKLVEQGKCSKCNLEGADLSGMDLSFANLEGANLKGANLSRSILRDANLKGASLEGANLSDADLVQTYLTDTDFSRANLTQSDLTFTNAVGAIWVGANLRGTKLIDAHLDRSDFSGADLSNADVSGAILIESTFKDAKLNATMFHNNPDFPIEKLSDSQKCEADIIGDNLEVLCQ